MKIWALIAIVLFSNSNVLGQKWSSAKLEKANTAKNIPYLSIAEKEAIMYINLARLFPSEFAKNEVEKYHGPAEYGNYLEKSTFLLSLIKDLKELQPMNPLQFDFDAYQNAKCFAQESGENGIVGHNRINCVKGNYAECCSYGMKTGLDIALQWLIDHDVASLGHRINCLNREYTKIGLSMNKHTKYGFCAVADMIW